MREPAALEGRTLTVVYLDADRGQLRLFEEQFADRFHLTLVSSQEELLNGAKPAAPVAALLADHGSGHGLLEKAPTLFPDSERLLVARSWELSQARAAVARGTVKRYFVKPWETGEVVAALEDAVRIFELRSQVRALRSRLQQS